MHRIPMNCVCTWDRGLLHFWLCLQHVGSYWQEELSFFKFLTSNSNWNLLRYMRENQAHYALHKFTDVMFALLLSAQVP